MILKVTYFLTSSYNHTGLLKTDVKCIICNINPKLDFSVGLDQISACANGFSVAWRGEQEEEKKGILL